MSTVEHPLEFEKEIAALEDKLLALREQISAGDEKLKGDHAKMEIKFNALRESVYGNLTPHQRVQLSRHFDRPFTLDYIQHAFTDFYELHGDRCFGDDAAIVGGLAKLGDLPVMIVGHQRGRSTADRLKRNFGMPNPEGYRKALRLFRLAEKFKRPIITFIDTQGAYPGLEAEERGQAEAIARNLAEMAELTVPVVCVVIGEGGSGGALALGVGDKILMMENACYSVISPEGCATILWHSEKGDAAVSMAPTASEILKVTAKDLKGLGVIDEVVPEPIGGAHWNHKEAADILKAAILKQFRDLSNLNVGELVEARYKKFRAMGPYTTQPM